MPVKQAIDGITGNTTCENGETERSRFVKIPFDVPNDENDCQNTQESQNVGTVLAQSPNASRVKNKR